MLSAFAVVTTTADAGPGSLRAALARVNHDASTNQDAIDFNIPTTDPGYSSSTGLFTIQLLSDLPTIKHPFSLDGETQPGFSSTPLVVVQRSMAASSTVSPRLLVDETAGTFNSFPVTIRSLALVGTFGSNGSNNIAIEVNDANTASSTQVDLIGNQISGPTHDGILLYAGTSTNTLLLSNNQITVSGRNATAINVFTGGTTTSVTCTSNQLDLVGLRAGFNGIVINEAGGATVDTLTLTGNSVVGTFAFAFSLDLADAKNTVAFDQNSASDPGGTGCYISGAAASTASVSITNSVFDTKGGPGVGLDIVGFSGLQALVQGNNFDNNREGVAVTTFNGTTAGTVDLGGGSLGSTGGNDFSTFRTNTNPWSFAIGLFNVASDYTLYAEQNTWGVRNPDTVIVDGIHKSAPTSAGVILP
jgi:hypothetical protein